MTIGTLALILFSVVCLGFCGFFFWYGCKECFMPANTFGVVLLVILCLMWMQTPAGIKFENTLSEIGDKKVFATEVDEEIDNNESKNDGSKSSYENLQPNQTYVITSEIIDKDTGKSTTSSKIIIKTDENGEIVEKKINNIED